VITAVDQRPESNRHPGRTRGQLLAGIGIIVVLGHGESRQLSDVHLAPTSRILPSQAGEDGWRIASGGESLGQRKCRKGMSRIGTRDYRNAQRQLPACPGSLVTDGGAGAAAGGATAP